MMRKAVVVTTIAQRSTAALALTNQICTAERVDKTQATFNEEEGG